MHPAFLYHWKRAREAAREMQAGCGPCSPHGEHARSQEASGPRDQGALFGVRRPLRFMAERLDLDDEQVKKLAEIMNDLKTERAQAEVDDRRTVGDFAAALESESFPRSKAEEALDRRVRAAERLRVEVLKALERTHAMLSPEQRSKLAYLLRSGALTI